jgi:general secretion pathway protein M
MPIRAWLEQLQPRERLLVTVAGALAVVALVIILGVRPLFGGTAHAAEQLADKQALLTELEQVASRIGPQTAGAASGGAADGQPLVLLVDRTTRARGLGSFLKRNEPDGANSIRLRFENAPFDALMEWLAEMQASHHVVTQNASIDPGQEAGRVSCSLQLTRSLG